MGGTRIFYLDVHVKINRYQTIMFLRATSRNGTICTPIFIPGCVRFWNGNSAVNENDPREPTPVLTLIEKKERTVNET